MGGREIKYVCPLSNAHRDRSITQLHNCSYFITRHDTRMHPHNPRHIDMHIGAYDEGLLVSDERVGKPFLVPVSLPVRFEGGENCVFLNVRFVTNFAQALTAALPCGFTFFCARPPSSATLS